RGRERHRSPVRAPDIRRLWMGQALRAPRPKRAGAFGCLPTGTPSAARSFRGISQETACAGGRACYRGRRRGLRTPADLLMARFMLTSIRIVCLSIVAREGHNVPRTPRLDV